MEKKHERTMVILYADMGDSGLLSLLERRDQLVTLYADMGVVGYSVC